MTIARVFPRKTNASPDDGLAFFSQPPQILPEIDEVHVSVAFSFDMQRAEQLAQAWRIAGVAVKLGGPAFNVPGGDFVPGLYIRKGHVITSRGCHRGCWFCAVPKREGEVVRELPIVPGFNILDDNFLACSESHIRAVFDMLKQQPEKPIFSGGLDSRLLRSWHVDLLRESKARRFYFAYDDANDYEPLVYAGKLLREGGITKASHRAKSYVLIGYPGDTMDKAETRLRDTWAAGFVPYAMLYKNESGDTDVQWRRFQRLWVRPEIVMSRLPKN